jgi:hypothetical protein
MAAALVLLGVGWHGALAAQEAAPAESDDAPPAPSQSVERVGYLRPNVSNPNIDAPYTLVDANGAINSYVRPVSGLRIGKYVNHRIRVRGDESSLGDRRGRVIDVANVSSPDAALGGQNVAPLDEPVSLRTTSSFARRAQYNETPPPPISDGFVSPAPAINGSAIGGPTMGEPMYDESGPPPGLNMSGPGPGPSVQWGGPGAPGAGGCSSCGGCGQQGCSSCGSCGGCCDGYCGPPGFIWVRAEYLFWWTEGMHVPPLVSVGPNGSPGYLDVAGTQILYGDDRVGGKGRSGGRITLGTWLNRNQTIGIEGDYFALQNGTSGYSGNSFATPGISRPYYDTELGANGLTLLGANVETGFGSVTANTWTIFQGAGIRGRFNICCKRTCADDYCCPSLNGPGGSRLDFLLGYRYLQLRDSISINEFTQNTNSTTTLNDGFTTRNQFNGVDLGASYTSYRGRWSFEFIPRMALGYNYEVADINGSTSVTTFGGGTTNFNGGLLAQASNIGHYTRNEFAVVPELGSNLGFQLTPRLKLIAGYTFIYWSRVARAGNLIDTNVNGSVVTGGTVTGDTRSPMFAWKDTDFWAQGVNVGLDYRW